MEANWKGLIRSRVFAPSSVLQYILHLPRDEKLRMYRAISADHTNSYFRRY